MKRISAQETEAETHWIQVAGSLRERHPELADRIDGSREDILAYIAFPKEHWSQIAGANPLERSNEEIKRRSRTVGVFSNDAAVARPIGALMLEQNGEWIVSRRRMTLEASAKIAMLDQVGAPELAA